MDVPPGAVDSLGVPPGSLHRQRLLREFPSLLLGVLACVQMGLALGANLSPWKGGGFGMFATNDHGSFRSVRAYAQEPGGEHRFAIPSELLQAELRARDFPTEARLRRFARALSPAAPFARAIRIEVWRAEFDAELHPTYRKLAAATWSAP